MSITSMCLPYHFGLPDSFARQYRPVRVHRDKKGLSAYLFDAFGLDFYRNLTTAETVPPNAIWSVMADPSSAALLLQSAWRSEAIGYVVTDAPHEPPAPSVWPLPRRLTYHQKLRLSVLRGLLAELREAPFPVPAEIIGFIEGRTREGA